MSMNMIVPEIAFQSNQFILIILVPCDVTDNDLVFVVAVETAEIDLIQIHDAHIVAPLELIVYGDTFDTVYPPIILGVIVGGLDLQYCCFSIWQLDEVVHISQHERMHGMIEHFLDLIHTESRFLMEYLCDQIFEQMPDFFLRGSCQLAD